MSVNVAETVLEVIAEFKDVPLETINLDTPLTDLGVDSLDGLNLIFELEEKFDVLVPDSNALQMRTIREIVEGMEKLVAAKTAV